jgi:sugar/nucleoside kinase (ribokinase family)
MPKSMPADVIVVGDVMADVAVLGGELVPGGDVQGEVRIRPGGAGANAAVWASAADARVQLFGRVGNDLAGRLLQAAVREHDVEGRLAVDPEARTGAMLVVRDGPERSMVADRGANARLTPHDLPDRLVAGAVLVSGYLFFHPGSEPVAVAALARTEADVVAVDAASWPLLEAYGPERFLVATKEVTLMLANAREAETLTSWPGMDAVKALADRYPMAAVKLGAEGAVLSVDGRVLSARVAPVDPVDPTGAGDAFDGVLVALLARGTEPETALQAACEAGSLAAGSSETWPDAR